MDEKKQKTAENAADTGATEAEKTETQKATAEGESTDTQMSGQNTENEDNGSTDVAENAAENGREGTEDNAADGGTAMDTDTAPGRNAAPNVAEDMNARVNWLSAQLMSAKATEAARAAGIAPERIKYALRLANLDGIDVTAEDADRKIGAALNQVAREVPELCGKPANTTGTPGVFARQSTVKMTPFERGLNG